MSAVIHAKQSGLPADDGDASKVQPSDWYAAHTVDWAEAADLAPVATAAVEGTSTEVPRGDHAHQDSAAGRLYAAANFR